MKSHFNLYNNSKERELKTNLMHIVSNYLLFCLDMRLLTLQCEEMQLAALRRQHLEDLDDTGIDKVKTIQLKIFIPIKIISAKAKREY